ncbi:hypothetical protein [Flavobacterium laiguense]|jgi:hypothetical protein|uniref:Lipoprotein n=1 Tax=Flavobacterium laiguense TaxID=2169409 RepID=A0A2U1JR46_9FLAO|nr:hypothetical protein [Flavobacterium laiguense]PWA07660.1 hypothetical protein DB891_14240 [Flavobacterium laiguense]
MKKVFLSLAVVAVLTVVSCKKADAAAEETVAVDSTAVVADTAAVVADTAAVAVDSAAATTPAATEAPAAK